MNTDAVAERAARILREVERAVVGKRDVLELVLLGLLADGHVLIEDNPGLAKTLTARSFAAVTGMRFARVQFTPDLMPSDVTGSAVYDQRSGELRFQPGPIFTNVLLGDEINRAPPKTQAALLEAMQERQVTSEDGTRELERPFLVLATQNPIEYEGTYPLPEAQLDRFLLRIRVGYPDRAAELELLARRLERGRDEVELDPVVDRAELLAMQRTVETVHADDGVLAYAVDLVTATRESPTGAGGCQPTRLARAAQAGAGQGGSAGTRLRHPRRRQARGRARARAPDHAASRAVGPAGPVRGRGARLPRALRGAAAAGPMTAAAPRLRVYAALATTALMAALISGRPQLAVLAMPFVLFVAVALATAPLALDGDLRLERDRALEGDRLHATLAIVNRGAPARVDIRLPAAARLRSDTAPPGLWLGHAERRELHFELTARRWGVHAVGPAIVAARDRLGATTLDGPLGGAAELRVYASAERLRRIVAPLRTRPVLGSQVSRELGDGIEFADLRPLATGDRGRSINWRATARRRAPYVNVQHPERSADVVLFLDTFAEAEIAEEGTLDTALRAAAALASAYLARRDRVALVSLGGSLSWLTGSLGTRQLYRIVDALVSSEVRPSFRWQAVTRVPRRLLPARALVLALSPLLDERGIAALLDLRARGYDLVVLEISPLTPADVESKAPAVRLWRLQRAAIRARFEALGIPVARWQPSGEGIEEVIASRRRARA